MTAATLTAPRVGRPPNSTRTPRVAALLEQLRELDRWVRPCELLPAEATEKRRIMLSGDLRILVVADLVEHNGRASKASRYRIVGATPEPVSPSEPAAPSRMDIAAERFTALPEDAPYVDLPRRWQGVVMGRVRKLVVEIVGLSPGRHTEPGLLDVIALSIPQADREVVALVCGELLEADALRLATNGTYWPVPKEAPDAG